MNSCLKGLKKWLCSEQNLTDQPVAKKRSSINVKITVINNYNIRGNSNVAGDQSSANCNHISGPEELDNAA